MRTLTSTPVDQAPPPRWPGSVVLALVTVLGAIPPWVFSTPSWELSNGGAVLPSLASLICIPVILLSPAPVLARGSAPFVTALLPAVVCLALPIGSIPALVGLGCLLARRRGSATWLAAFLVTLATSVSVARDAVASPIGASWLKYLASPTGTALAADAPAPAGLAVLLHGIGLVACVSTGLWLRMRWESQDAHRVARREMTRSAGLDAEITRREERERIAREVHDALGHRLSIISLHAGALEARAGRDEELARSAALVRESSARAVADLHSLLSVLRDPSSSAAPDLPLSRLPEIVGESTALGIPLSSSIFIEDAESASTTLSRAVYRIVQEILTNARRHAAGQPLTLEVTGSPSRGIIIDSSNPVEVGAASTSPSAETPRAGGKGLLGLSERVELLGGRIDVSSERGIFRIHVELPWQRA